MFGLLPWRNHEIKIIYPQTVMWGRCKLCISQDFPKAFMKSEKAPLGEMFTLCILHMICLHKYCVQLAGFLVGGFQPSKKANPTICQN